MDIQYYIMDDQDMKVVIGIEIMLKSLLDTKMATSMYMILVTIINGILLELQEEEDMIEVLINGFHGEI